MKRSRGFRLRRPKLARVFHWMIRPGRKSVCFLNPISGVFALSRWLLHGVKTLCLSGSGPTYIQLGRKESVATPKGHLAVYVADCNGGTRRVLVPVIYFNHPLFEELLKESERVHGYNHPGGITIPCDYSKFEKVKMRIAARDNCHLRRNSIARSHICLR